MKFTLCCKWFTSSRISCVQRKAVRSQAPSGSESTYLTANRTFCRHSRVKQLSHVKPNCFTRSFCSFNNCRGAIQLGLGSCVGPRHPRQLRHSRQLLKAACHWQPGVASEVATCQEAAIGPASLKRTGEGPSCKSKLKITVQCDLFGWGDAAKSLLLLP